MKKLLSLFSLLGLAGLLAFVATPIYAQEVEDDVSAAEVSYNDEFDYGAEEDVALEAEEDVALEAEEDVALEADAAVEDVDDLTLSFNEEELENLIAGLDDDQKELVAATGILGVFAGLGIAAWIIGLVWLVLVIIALWKIFEKAGEAGWKAIIPIYNVYIMYKIVGMKNWFWYTLIVAVVLGIVASFLPDYASIITGISSLFSGIVAIVAAFKLPRKFGWGVFTSILYVLFTGICILILGFGNYKYQGKSEETVVEA